jgi:hypothetical protein
MVMKLQVPQKHGKLLVSPSDYWLLKKDSAACYFNVTRQLNLNAFKTTVTQEQNTVKILMTLLHQRNLVHLI